MRDERIDSRSILQSGDLRHGLFWCALRAPARAVAVAGRVLYDAALQKQNVNFFLLCSKRSTLTPRRVLFHDQLLVRVILLGGLYETATSR